MALVLFLIKQSVFDVRAGEAEMATSPLSGESPHAAVHGRNGGGINEDLERFEVDVSCRVAVKTRTPDLTWFTKSETFESKIIVKFLVANARQRHEDSVSYDARATAESSDARRSIVLERVCGLECLQ